MSASATSVFFTGRPTTDEVNKLVEAFKPFNNGKLITVDAMEAFVGSKNTHRFRTVFYAFKRKIERQFNVVLVNERGIGYRVADSSARVDFATRGYKHGIRSVRKAGEVAAKTELSSLSPEEQIARDHIIRTSGMHVSMSQVEAKRMRLEIVDVSAKR